MILQYVVKGLLEIIAKEKAVRAELKNSAPAMKQVAVFLDAWVQRNFKGEGEKVGGWEKFQIGGRRHKGKKGVDTSAKLLQDTGLLRLSFLPFVREGVAGIGSDLPYSKGHDEGITGRLPQRRILMNGEDVQVDVQLIIDNWVKVTLQRAAGA